MTSISQKSSLRRPARKNACGFAAPLLASRKDRRACPELRRRAFTFTEVMFAVVILGIGFIMVAAILPVAIQQSKSGNDQSAGTNLSAAAIRNLAATQVNQYCLFPPTIAAAAVPGKVYFFGDANNPFLVTPLSPPAAAPAQFTTIANVGNFYTTNLNAFRSAQLLATIGSLVNPDDPRYGWIGFYQRGWVNVGGTFVVSPLANITILTIHSSIRPTYNTNSSSSTCDLPYNFIPTGCRVWLTERVDQPDLITFTDGSNNQMNHTHAVTGAFVIISDDQVAAPNTGKLNGRIYRLGNQRTDLGVGTWELQSGYDMTYTNPNGIIGDGDDVNENIPVRAVDPNPANRIPPTSGTYAIGYIVGRQLEFGTVAEGAVEPVTGKTNTASGPAQDVSVFQTIIPVQQ